MKKSISETEKLLFRMNIILLVALALVITVAVNRGIAYRDFRQNVHDFIQSTDNMTQVHTLQWIIQNYDT